MQKQEKKYFNLGIDADTQDFVSEPGSALNGRNLRYATTDKGAIGGLENIGATRLITNALPSGTNITLGTTEDETRQRGIFFNWNSLGEHGIYCFDKGSDTIYKVLLSSQVEGGLNFDKDWLIHSANVVGDLLYWVNDRVNEPRRINIEAGIKMNHPSYVTDVLPYVALLKQEEITLLRKPPMYPITFAAGTSTNPGNFIRDFAFQFAYRYVYRDFEVSVLSMYSKTAGFLLASETHNAWQLTIPVTEKINNDVLRVELIVKDLQSNKYFIIKTWDKEIAAEATQIINHNAATALLSYTFANDQIGIALADADAAEPFHSIPIYSATEEVAKNRLFLGNNDRGLTAPKVTSLQAVAVEDENGTTVGGEWWRLEFLNSGFGASAVRFVIRIPDAPVPGYYEWNGGIIDPVVPIYPPSIDFTVCTFVGAGSVDVWNYYNIPAPYDTVNSFYPVTSTNYTTVLNVSVVNSLVGKKVFKSGAAYRVAITFDDYGDRHSGAVTNESLKLVTADREYGSIAYTRTIDWTLSNDERLVEIPVWAKTYTILITKCLRTRSFQQIRVFNMTYVGKDVNGEYTFNTSAYSATHQGVGVQIGAFIPYGLGYTYTEGDLIKIYIGTAVHELEIKAQEGDWLVVGLKDLGALSSSTAALIEIYTPFKESFNEPFFEVANRYPILEPGTNFRRYSTTAGSIEGDTWLLSRSKDGSAYLAEAMSPLDKYWYIWNVDAGRVVIIDKIGGKTRDRNICFSNVYQEGTGVNGLSNFDALDFTDLPIENGPIEKLILTSKVQDEGSVMLAICRYDVSSVYLGEAQISDSSGATAFFSKAQGVIGTINPLKGGHGTQHPESVCRTIDDLVFWIDVNTEAAVFYSLNGINSVSDNRMTRFFRAFCRQYRSMTRAQIEALGSRPFLPGVCDPYHKEVHWTIPQLLADNPNGELEDYPGREYPYDVWDGKSKTIVYKYPLDRWFFPLDYDAEYFLVIGNETYGFKAGAMYEHNVAELGYNMFYGVQHKSWIAFVANQEASLIKIWKSLSVECNFIPDFVHFRSENPNVQSSDLANVDFRNYEQVWYAAILRDRLSPNKTGSYNLKMNIGDMMRCTALRVLIEWSETTAEELIQLKHANLIYSDSEGHKI